MESTSKPPSTDSSVRIKLIRSNSCAASNEKKSNFTHSLHSHKLLSVDEKPMLIKNILKEIKQEKPLGKCPLFKMALTFSSFVWSNTLDSLYNDSLYQQRESIGLSNKKSVEPLKKFLVRSNSATSFKSTKTNKTLEEQSGREPLTTDLSLHTRSARRKDENKLSMLASVAHSSIKLKTHRPKNEVKQTDLISQRSLKLGAVPKYLTDRKDEWARKEEERIKNLPDPDCPINHILMPELERASTLAQLQNSHKEMMDEYNCLPVSKDTLRIRQKKENLEKQMIKLEEGIRVLSKPKVFVRIDR